VFSDSLKTKYDIYIKNKAKTLETRAKATDLIAQNDSLPPLKVVMPILTNYKIAKQIQILESARTNIERSLKNFSDSEKGYKWKRKRLNLIDTEFHRRIALSFSALLLFLIGAPLGSLIRKGGFGLPMVVAILVYLAYHFLSTFAGNMAETSTINHRMGGWLSTLFFLPFGFYLIYRATNDKGAINTDSILNFLKKAFRSFKKAKK
jgi:lipopolysaccharide export system permease protein